MDDYQSDVSSQDLQDELNRNNHNVTVTPLGNNLKVLFNDTGHMYTVGQDGQVGDLTEEDLKKIVKVGMINDDAIYYEVANGNVYALNIEEDSGIINENTENGIMITNVGIRESTENGFIDNLGKVYTWGDNKYGQVGDGTNETKVLPVCISDIEGNPLKDRNIIQILSSNEGYNYIAIDDSGKVYTWGKVYDENGEEIIQNIPVCISDIQENELYNKKIIKAYAGNGNYYVIDEEGTVYAWGENFWGEIGIGNNEIVAEPICLNKINDSGLNNVKVDRINDYIALDIDGKVYAWWEDSLPVCVSDTEGSPLKNKRVIDIIDNEYLLDADGKIYTIDYDLNVVCLSALEELYNAKIIKIFYNQDNINDFAVGISDDGKAYVWQYETFIGCINDDEDDVLYGKKIVDVDQNKVVCDDGKIYYIYVKAPDIIECISDSNINLKDKKIIKSEEYYGAKRIINFYYTAAGEVVYEREWREL